MKSKVNLESRMQKCLDQLNVPLQVLWIPKDEASKHGEIRSNCILIYDREEAEAWLTFEHEVYEYKFKEVTFPYRTLVNSLIEALEKLTYERKESALTFFAKASKSIREGKSTRANK
jgi:hypothetical protein